MSQFRPNDKSCSRPIQNSYKLPQEVLDTLGEDYARNYCDPSSVVKKFSEDKKQEEDWDNESDDSPVTFSLLRTNQNTDQ